MTITRKFRNVKKNKKIKKSIGGALESRGLPECNILSQFKITDSDLQILRDFKLPMDCFINALQIMKVLDNKSANIMRLSSLEKQKGFLKEEIEVIFIYNFMTNFDFKSTNSYQVWSNLIIAELKPAHVVFAGYDGHVFLIGRKMNGKIFYIDPQVPTVLCDLSDPNCEGFLQNKNNYFLLFNSMEILNKQQQELVKSYVYELPKILYNI